MADVTSHHRGPARTARLAQMAGAATFLLVMATLFVPWAVVGSGDVTRLTGLDLLAGGTVSLERLDVDYDVPIPLPLALAAVPLAVVTVVLPRYPALFARIGLAGIGACMAALATVLIELNVGFRPADGEGSVAVGAGYGGPLAILAFSFAATLNHRLRRAVRDSEANLPARLPVRVLEAVAMAPVAPLLAVAALFTALGFTPGPPAYETLARPGDDLAPGRHDGPRTPPL